MRRPLLLLGLAAAAFGAAPAQAASPAPGQRVITFAEGTTPAQAQTTLSRHGARQVDRLGATNIYRARFKTATAYKSAGALRNAGGVNDVAYNPRVHIAEQVPAELARNPEYLWFLRNSGTEGGTAGADVSAPGAWDLGFGAGQLVAVVDTGAAVDHPDLAGQFTTNLAEQANGLDDDRNGMVDDIYGANVLQRNGNVADDHGHGTFISGLIAAKSDSGGLIGLAPQAKVLPVKALAANGAGNDFDLARGIYYAMTRGAKVINLSVAAPRYSTTLKAVMDMAEARGVLIVAAAGNAAADNDRAPTYPSSFAHRNVVAVAASTRNDLLASFSNFGARRVDIAAPGETLASASPDGKYVYGSGTSYASPLVAAAAALVRAQAPTLGAEGIKSRLLKSAARRPALAGRMTTGGRLDTNAAVRSVSRDRTAPGKVRVRARASVSRRASRALFSWRKSRGAHTYRLVVGGRVVRRVSSPRRGRTVSARVKLRRGRTTWTVTAIDRAGNERTSTAKRIRIR